MKTFSFIFAIMFWIVITATILMIFLEIARFIFLRIIKRIEYGYW
ncbi:hypothetical protein MNBD_IGNAVI01-1039 [hydrothermal vent metagenome]|uniref:Uncharacterized protein n=1 Tax=hydrothermal vent metagenome TaxID=652676 RepID=A0A3B1CRP5_9ZZZZ